MKREDLLRLLFDCQAKAIKEHDSETTAKVSYLIADLIDTEYRR